MGAPKLFEEQTSKGFGLLSAIGRIISYKCNNCEYEFSYDPSLKQKLICGKCGNV